MRVVTHWWNIVKILALAAGCVIAWALVSEAIGVGGDVATVISAAIGALSTFLGCAVWDTHGIAPAKTERGAAP